MDKLEIKELCLSQLDRQTLIKKTAMAQYPGTACGFRVVTNNLQSIKNSRTLLVGTDSCLFNARLTMKLCRSMANPLIDNLALLPVTDGDLIFGMGKKIRSAVDEISAQKEPEVLFVVTTCIIEMIGAELDMLVDTICQEVSFPIVVIHTEQFTCNGPERGLENMMKSLIQLMKPQPVNKKSINLWGCIHNPFPGKSEIGQWLIENGYEINATFPGQTSLAQLQKAPGASLNLVMGSYGIPLVQAMESSFGIPYLAFEMPCTPDSIADLYYKIANQLAIRVDFQEEKFALNHKVAQVKQLLSGKTCVLGMFHGMQTGRIFNLVELFTQLGIRVKGLLVREVLAEDWDDLQRLQLQGIDFPILQADNSIQSEAFINRLQPDFYCGDSAEFGDLEIPCVTLMSVLGLNGFEAVNTLLQLLLKIPEVQEIKEYRKNYLKKWGNYDLS